MGTRIKDAALVGNVSEGYKIPVSDGSSQPKTASVGQISEFVNQKYGVEQKLSELGSKIDGNKLLVTTDVVKYIPYNIFKGETYILDITDAAVGVGAALFVRNSDTADGQKQIASLSSVRTIEFTAESDFDRLYVYFSTQGADSASFSFKNKNNVNDKLNSNIELTRKNSTDIESLKTSVGKNIIEIGKINSRIIPLKDVYMACLFNGTSSKCTINGFTLSKEGDYIEIDVAPGYKTNEAGYYGLARGNSEYNISLGCSQTEVAVRASNGTWLCQTQILQKSRYKIGVFYRNGNIETEVDGEIIATYSGYTPIVIKGFGIAASVSSYWKGYIGELTINGAYYKTIEEIEGYNSTDISIEAPNGFLTQNQMDILHNIDNENIYVIPAEDIVYVFMRINNNIYARLDIKHSVNHTDNDGQNGYCDLWGLYGGGGMYEKIGDSLNPIDSKLLVGAENEFTIAFAGMGDFTGGFHGDERIDIEEDDFVEFVVNGKTYSLSEIISKGNIMCDTFSYRQRSTLYASYVYNENHIKIGKHFKETSFNKGYVTRNFIKLDLSLLGIESLNVTTAFTGLVCPHKNIAHIIHGDNGDEYIATNPTTSVSLVDNINTYSRRVYMENGDYSCCIDSKVIDTSIEDWRKPSIRVQIMDRKDDSKYYSYLKGGVEMKNEDFLATECEVSFNVCKYPYK